MKFNTVSWLGGILVLLAILLRAAWADETCMSPCTAKIVGQEDYVYVWTLGSPGVGDEQDKLITIDVNPASATLLSPPGRWARRNSFG